MKRLPPWLIKKTPKQENLRKIRALIGENGIHTVCESAHCPNLGECYSQNTLTFMILGEICTRDCKFCAVEKGNPLPIDENEPERIAAATEKLNLNYVVVTSVTRDDLPDGGASQFAKVVEALKSWKPEAERLGFQNDSSEVQLETATFPPEADPPSEDSRRFPARKVEVLIPDFQGNTDALSVVLESDPDVLSHNVETVPRLYPEVRPMANYEQSLEVLRYAKELDSRICTKSGFMVGLGETEAEIFEVLRDLRGVGCDRITIGQYLAPSPKHISVREYLKPEIFEDYKQKAIQMGFLHVEAGPFVRSSYQAGGILDGRFQKSR